MGTFGTAPTDVRAIRQDVAEATTADGFAVVRAERLRTIVADEELVPFSEFWNDLHLDEDLPDGATFRYRRYGRLRVETGPHGVSLDVLPHVSFRQDSIPLWSGSERRFAPIEDRVLLHPGMAALVRFDTEVATELSDVRAWTVGIHQIRMIARPGVQGLPTPEGRHRDGHHFVGMHLINRVHCDGGESTIYPERRDPVRLTLTDPLDSMVVDDRRVTHEVSPIRATGADGVRDMLFVDINPACAAG